MYTAIIGLLNALMRVDGPSSYGVVPAVAPDNIIIRDTNYITFHEHGAGGNTGGGVAD